MTAQPASPPFDFARSLELAALAFEAYQPPPAGTAECGSDTTTVILHSPEFAAKMYEGALEVHVTETSGLPRWPRHTREAVLTGPACDPYVLLSMVDARAGTRRRLELSQARDVIRTDTRWRRSGAGASESSAAPAGEEGGDAPAGSGEVRPAEASDETSAARPALTGGWLFVERAERACLRLELRDQNVLCADESLGHAFLPLSELQGALADGDGAAEEHVLSVEYPAPVGPGPLLGVANGWLLGGVAGGAAGLVAGALGAARTSCATVTVRCRYVRFEGGGEGSVRRVPGLAQPPAWPPERGLGGSEGIDWTQLRPSAGEADPSRFAPLASIDNAHTDTQATLWCDAARRELVLAFRGTEQLRFRDLLVDASITQVEWGLAGASAAALCDRGAGFAPRVHAGFAAAWRSVAPRVAEQIVAAIGARGGERGGAPGFGAADEARAWTLYCTGHSLGGALATLAALDLAQGALPLGRIGLYTLGAPRVGNPDLASLADALLPEAFRLVNGQDVVTRMPRGAASAMAGPGVSGVLDYAHPGRTVLIDEREPLCTVAGAGLEGVCPLEVIDSPFDDPLRAKAGADAVEGSARGLVSGLERALERALRLARSDMQRAGLGAEPALALAGGGGQGGAEPTPRPRGASIVALARTVRRTTRAAAADVSATIAKSTGGRVRPSDVLKATAALFGVQGAFVEAELQLLGAIRRGDALAHHLEPSYYAAMEQAGRAAATDSETPAATK